GAALVVVLWMGLTGLLHMDGLADSADAWLGGHGDPGRTLEIMKEPTTGPAGIALMVGVIVVKVAALAALLPAGAALVAAPVLARAGTTWLLLTTNYVRDEGMGATAAANLPTAPAYAAVTLAVLFGLFLTGTAGFAAIVTGAIVLVFLRWLMQHRIGGVTGDSLGAAIELVEAALLAVFAYALT
ncbi:MAG TPA: adenosylcobinamide-GDP ribazoletransferase, partial [Gammaproteobacteria bacterium]|nr:adenosylcobinamide-GDP ribazoletransferase [Gammaproteobacteria bacterium]